MDDPVRDIDSGAGCLGFQLREARASVALDGDTQALAAPPEGVHEGFGCPGCGSPLRLDSDYVARSLSRSHQLPCCGYAPDDDELGRWMRAAQLIRER